jgi:hypothetical protein
VSYDADNRVTESSSYYDAFKTTYSYDTRSFPAVWADNGLERRVGRLRRALSGAGVEEKGSGMGS